MPEHVHLPRYQLMIKLQHKLKLGIAPAESDFWHLKKVELIDAIKQINIGPRI